MYNTNAEEADMRIWRHAYQSKATKILIYSPDTDVYNIGMSLTSITSHQDCIVQINLPHTREQKFINLTNLLKALDNDPDLAGIPRKLLANIFQLFQGVTMYRSFLGWARQHSWMPSISTQHLLLVAKKTVIWVITVGRERLGRAFMHS